MNILVVLILPAIVLFFAVLMKLSLGPYWLGSNLDPAYQYLLNGLNILNGIVPAHTDHPGTTLQTLISLVIRASHPFTSSSGVDQALLSNPECHMNAVWVVLTVVHIVLLALLGHYILRRSANRVAAIAAQAAALFFVSLPSYLSETTVIPVVANVFPETLLMSVMGVYAILVVRIFLSPKDNDSIFLACAWGGLSAFGLITKVTFLPFVLAPFFLLTPRRIVFYVGVLVAGMIGFLMPVWSRMEKIVTWFVGVVDHSGRHGLGKPGFLDVSEALKDFAIVARGQWVFFTFLILLIIFAVWLVRKMRTDQQADPLKLRIFLVVLGACILQVLLVFKHPGEHYLLPAMSGAGILMALIALMRFQVLPVVFILFMLMGTLLSGFTYARHLNQDDQKLLTFSKQVETVPAGCILLPYFRSSSQEYALVYGLIQGGGWGVPRYNAVLNKRFPKRIFYHIWSGFVHDFSSRESIAPLLKRAVDEKMCLMFYGKTDEIALKKFPLALVATGGVESVYRFVIPPTEVKK